MTNLIRTDTATKKDIQKLQRAIVDGLEDVKAQDIQVFDTESLSPLFERVMVASGTSNRQTKGLAASVIDAVRDAGFAKPRVEGAENGEWIIVDCGRAVVHIMQPAIRQYYRLEELWGDKPVRLKLGAPKPVAPPAKKASKAASAKTAVTSTGARQPTGKANAGKPAPDRTGAKTVRKVAGSSTDKPRKTVTAPKAARKSPTPK